MFVWLGRDWSLMLNIINFSSKIMFFMKLSCKFLIIEKGNLSLKNQKTKKFRIKFT